MALNLVIALMLFPALRLSVGAFSNAISRIGPSLWEAVKGGRGDDVWPAEVTDQVLWVDEFDLLSAVC